MDLDQEALRRMLAVDRARRLYPGEAPAWLLGFRTGPTIEARALIDQTINTIVQLHNMPYLVPRFHHHSGRATQLLFDHLKEFDGDGVGFALWFRLFVQGHDLRWDDAFPLDCIDGRYLEELRAPGPMTQDRALFFLMPDVPYIRLTSRPDSEIGWLRAIEMERISDAVGRESHRDARGP